MIRSLYAWHGACLACGGCSVNALFPTPLLAAPLCWPIPFILKALMIPNISTEAFGYRGFHTCDKMYLSQLNEAGIITMIPFGSYKLRIRESQ